MPSEIGEPGHCRYIVQLPVKRHDPSAPRHIIIQARTNIAFLGWCRYLPVSHPARHLSLIPPRVNTISLCPPRADTIFEGLFAHFVSSPGDASLFEVFEVFIFWECRSHLFWGVMNSAQLNICIIFPLPTKPKKDIDIEKQFDQLMFQFNFKDISKRLLCYYFYSFFFLPNFLRIYHHRQLPIIFERWSL